MDGKLIKFILMKKVEDDEILITNEVYPKTVRMLKSFKLNNKKKFINWIGRNRNAGWGGNSTKCSKNGAAAI
jgi:hypothetical protein